MGKAARASLLLFAITLVSGCGGSVQTVSLQPTPTPVRQASPTPQPSPSPTPAPTPFPEIAAWGDSLTAGNEDGSGVRYPGVLSQIRNTAVLNEGIGGQTSTQIATRMLSQPAMFGDVAIIWAGRNNYTDPATVKSDICKNGGCVVRA